jgi:hypothetical protein
MPRSHERSYDERTKCMSNLILQCKDNGDFVPHPEGIHPAVCVDVMDLGLVETDFQGQRRMVNKVKIVFESEAKTPEGKPCMVSKNFTASLHPKARLAEFLGKWRGRPVMPGETIDLGRLLGACCTLVISHQQNLVGKTYASIDAVSKPTRKVMPSGTYDPAAARQRYAERSARIVPAAPRANVPAPRPFVPQPAPVAPAVPFKSGAASAPPASAPAADYDPEVGF